MRHSWWPPVRILSGRTTNCPVIFQALVRHALNLPLLWRQVTQSNDPFAVQSSTLPSYCPQPVMPRAEDRTLSFLPLPQPPMFFASSPILNVHFCLGATKSFIDFLLYQWLWGIPWHVLEEVTPKHKTFTRRWWWYELSERLSRKDSRIKVIRSYLTLPFCITGTAQWLLLPPLSLYRAGERTQHCADSECLSGGVS